MESRVSRTWVELWGTWHWTEWGKKAWLAVPWSLVVHSSIESSCRTYTTRKWEKWEYQRKRWAQDGAWRRQIWSKDEKSELFCSYMKPSGVWSSKKRQTCMSMKLCAMCSISETPVFTLKGSIFNVDRKLCSKCWTQNYCAFLLSKILG